MKTSTLVRCTTLLDCSAVVCLECGCEWAGFNGLDLLASDPECISCGGKAITKEHVEFQLCDGEPGDYPPWGIYRCYRKDPNYPDDPFCEDAGEDVGWYHPIEATDPCCGECGKPMLLVQRLKIVAL